MTNLQTAVAFLLIFAGSGAVLFIITRFIRLLILLRHELHYINMEIQRATGEERDYWLEQRRKLFYDWITGRK